MNTFIREKTTDKTKKTKKKYSKMQKNALEKKIIGKGELK